MNINYFFSFISLILLMIYIFFDPMEIKQINSKEIPLFSLDNFTLHELDTHGLTTLMNGSKGKRYSDRYDVSNIDYTDNSKEFISNMKAKHGLYQKEVVYLNGDVFFTRVDGLRYFSQKAVYNKKTEIVLSDVEYVALMGMSQLSGNTLQIDNKNKTMRSKNIYAIYNFKEKP